MIELDIYKANQKNAQMSSLRESIKQVYQNTKLTEVKTLCERYLNAGSTDEAGIISELSQFSDKDKLVESLMQQHNDYRNTISSMETEISKRAAANLMEWAGPKKVSNVGNLIDNNLKAENIAKQMAETALFEKLNGVDEVAAKKYVTSKKAVSFGIADAIKKISESKIYSHPNVRYAVGGFEQKLEDGFPESMLVREFVSIMDAFKWDETVAVAIAPIRESLDTRLADIEVANAAFEISSNDKQRFFGDLVNKMYEWLSDEKRNTPALIRDLRPWQFNQSAKALTNNLLLMENTKGKLNMTLQSSNCDINPIYSPILLLKEGQVFKAGNFYLSSESGVSLLNQDNVNALPKEYLELCEDFFSENVRVADENVTIYMGRNKVKITQDKHVFVNENEVKTEDLGKSLLHYTNTSIFGSDTSMINVCKNIFENMDSICEVDYGKQIASNVYEGVSVYMFKKSGKIYLNKVNPSMNENSFVEVNGTQAVNAVKDYIGYDVSESVVEFLSGENKQRVILEQNSKGILDNISIVEAQIEKIEAAISEDPFMMDIPEIMEAKTVLEEELNKLQSEWRGVTSKIKEMEEAPVEKEEEEKEPTEAEAEEAEAEEDAEGLKNSEVEGEEIEEVEGEEVEGEEAAAPVSSDILDNGLLGAGGQANSEIVGNDNMGVVSAEVEVAPDGKSIIDAGFAGADGAQSADIITAVVTAGEVDAETGDAPASMAPASVDAVPAEVEAGEEEAVEVPAEGVGEEPAEKEEGEKEETDAKDSAEGEEEGEEENDKEEITEKLAVSSKVKIKDTDKVGEVQSIDGEEFNVLLDDGATGKFTSDQLEELDAEIADKIEDNEEEAKKPEAVEEAEEGEDTDVLPETAYVKATITINMGDYLAGDQVEVDATGYTSGGEGDLIMLKDPKGIVTAVPKKYLKIAEVEKKSAE